VLKKEGLKITDFKTSHVFEINTVRLIEKNYTSVKGNLDLRLVLKPLSTKIKTYKENFNVPTTWSQ
jgi:polyisoprenoid-binding protein YceI